MTKFYLFSDPLKGRPFRGKVDDAVTRNAIRYKRGEALPDAPVVVTWEMGGAEPTDVVWTTSAQMVLIHERIRLVLKEFKFTGWRTFPVKLFDKAERLRDDYHCLSVVGRCGAIERERARREVGVFPGGKFPIARGLYFDDELWDGSAFFMSTDGSGWTFVTEDVRDALVHAECRNVAFEPTPDVELPILTL